MNEKVSSILAAVPLASIAGDSEGIFDVGKYGFNFAAGEEEVDTDVLFASTNSVGVDRYENALLSKLIDTPADFKSGEGGDVLNSGETAPEV